MLPIGYTKLACILLNKADTFTRIITSGICYTYTTEELIQASTAVAEAFSV